MMEQVEYYVNDFLISDDVVENVKKWDGKLVLSDRRILNVCYLLLYKLNST